MKRKVFASREMSIKTKKTTDKRVKVYSFFPVDRAHCPCHASNTEWKKKLAKLNEDQREALIIKTKYLTCPRDKSGMSRYKITCKNCNEAQGFCWATDNTLKDWCDFHYTNWTDGKEWFGCLTPHISPISEELCFECTCGEDTRDFRANMTLPGKVAIEMEEKASKGRKFGKRTSTYKVRKVGASVLPFNK